MFMCHSASAEWTEAGGLTKCIDQSVEVELILGGVTMDHSQSKLEPDYRQTDSTEILNSNLNKEEEELKEVSKDHATPIFRTCNFH
jgi:hypothetical protein